MYRLSAAAIRLLEGDNVSLALESMENPKISTDISSRRPVSLVLSYIFDTTAGSGEGELHSLLSALLQQLALKLPERAPEIFQACEKAGSTVPRYVKAHPTPLRDSADLF